MDVYKRMILPLILSMRYISTTPMQSSFEDYVCSNSGSCEGSQSSEDSNSNSSMHSDEDVSAYRISYSVEYLEMSSKLFECVSERKKCIGTSKSIDNLRLLMLRQREKLESYKKSLSELLVSLLEELTKHKDAFMEICNSITDFLKAFERLIESETPKASKKELLVLSASKSNTKTFTSQFDRLNLASDETETLSIRPHDMLKHSETAKTAQKNEEKTETIDLSKLEHIAEALIGIYEQHQAFVSPTKSMMTLFLNFFELYSNYVNANKDLKQLRSNYKYILEFGTTTERLIADALNDAKSEKQKIHNRLRETLNKISSLDELIEDDNDDDSRHKKIIVQCSNLQDMPNTYIEPLCRLRRDLIALFTVKNTDLSDEISDTSKEHITLLYKTIDGYISSYRKLEFLVDAKARLDLFVDAEITEVIIAFKQVILRVYTLLLSLNDQNFDDVDAEVFNLTKDLHDELARVVGVFYLLVKQAEHGSTEDGFYSSFRMGKLDELALSFSCFLVGINDRLILRNDSVANAVNPLIIEKQTAEFKDQNAKRFKFESAFDFELLKKYHEDISKFFDEDKDFISEGCEIEVESSENLGLDSAKEKFDDKSALSENASLLLEEIRIAARAHASNHQNPKSMVSNFEIDLYHNFLQEKMGILTALIGIYGEYISKKQIEIQMLMAQKEMEKCFEKHDKRTRTKMAKKAIVRFQIVVERLEHLLSKASSSKAQNHSGKDGIKGKHPKFTQEMLFEQGLDQTLSRNAMIHQTQHILGLSLDHDQHLPFLSKTIQEFIAPLRFEYKNDLNDKGENYLSCSINNFQDLLHLTEYFLLSPSMHNLERPRECSYILEYMKILSKLKYTAFFCFNAKAMEFYREFRDRLEFDTQSHDKETIEAISHEKDLILQSIEKYEANKKLLSSVLSNLQQEIDKDCATGEQGKQKNMAAALTTTLNVQVSQTTTQD